MSNFINTLINGFSNILSVGLEESKEGSACAGTNGEGCCKDQPTNNVEKEGGCQTEGDACCSSTPAQVKKEVTTGGCCKTETKKEETSSGCCKTEVKKEEVSGGCCKTDTNKEACACEGEQGPVVIENLKIIFSTLTGTAKTMAAEIEKKVQDNTRVTVNKIDIMDITEYDNDNLLQETAVCVFILSTYNVEGPLDW